MFYRVEEGFNDFEFWGEAKNVIDQLFAYDDEHRTHHYEDVAGFAEDFFNEGEDYTATDINDWVAYDVPNMLERPWTEVFN